VRRGEVKAGQVVGGSNGWCSYTGKGPGSGRADDLGNGSPCNGSGNGAEVASHLTPGEKSALEELDSGIIRRRLAAPEAERLLTLGLAELSFGSLVLTMAGRHVLMAIRDR